MKTVFLSDRGKVRQHNEDSTGVFRNLDGHILAVVADGMGGHRAGDVASSMAVGLFHDYWEKTKDINTPRKAEEWLRIYIAMVNEQLYLYAAENPSCRGMGTTIVAAVCTEHFVTIAHVGDSRCYMVTEGEIHLVTEDHTLVNELVRHGEISKEAADTHPRKHVILRALGTEEQVKIDIKTLVVEEGDQVLLCSDGLSNKLTSEQLQETMNDAIELENKARRLVDMANMMGGEDNITVILVDYQPHESGCAT